MTPRPPEAIYVRKEGDAYLVGFLNVPKDRVPDSRFTDQERALRLAREMQKITGGNLIINLEERLQ